MVWMMALGAEWCLMSSPFPRNKRYQLANSHFYTTTVLVTFNSVLQATGGNVCIHGLVLAYHCPCYLSFPFVVCYVALITPTYVSLLPLCHCYPSSLFNSLLFNFINYFLWILTFTMSLCTCLNRQNVVFEINCGACIYKLCSWQYISS